VKRVLYFDNEWVLGYQGKKCYVNFSPDDNPSEGVWESRVGTPPCAVLEGDISEVKMTVVEFEAERLWRGGRIQETHLQWFEQHVGFVRSARAVSTTQNQQTALKFMVQHGHPQNDAEFHLVLFELHMKDKCDHVNVLDVLSTVEGEVEWLFTPFSAFEVIAVHRDQPFSEKQTSYVADVTKAATEHCSSLKSYQLVQLAVVPDNRTSKDGGILPEGLPIIPWM